VPAFGSPGGYQVVDGGTGTPAELAAANVQGKLVIIHEIPDPNDPNAVFSYEVDLDPEIANAAAAGAAGVLYAVADSGPPVRSLHLHPAIPVAIITNQQGQQLARAAQAGPVTVHTGGTPVSPYLYDLLETVNGGLPANPVLQARTDQLATINARYHADSPGQIDTEFRQISRTTWISAPSDFSAPAARTEYVTPGIDWNQTISAYQPGVADDITEHADVTYQAGHVYTEDHLDGPVYPQPTGLPFPAVATGQGVINMENNRFALAGLNEWADASGNPLSITDSGNPGESEWTFSNDGTVLCDFPSYKAACNFSTSVSGPLTITGDTNAEGALTTSTTTHTVWTLANPSYSPTTLAPAALLLLHYKVPLDLTNTVTASHYQITVGANYQYGYSSPGPAGFTLTAWASYDGGQTWTALGSHPADGSGSTSFPLSTPPGATNVTLRVKATDAQGDSIDQTITQAWHV
jgi:hypothetical protein